MEEDCRGRQLKRVCRMWRSSGSKWEEVEDRDRKGNKGEQQVKMWGYLDAQIFWRKVWK